GVLQHARDRTVVFGRDEHDTVGRRDLALQALYRVGLVAVVVLVVQREVIDPRVLEGEFGRREPDDRVSQLSVERVLAQAADDYGDLVLAHLEFSWRWEDGGT